MEKVYLGDLIKDRRVGLGLTAADCVEEMRKMGSKTTQGSWSRWERNSSVPNMSNMTKIVKVLKQPIEDLLTGKELIFDK